MFLIFKRNSISHPTKETCSKQTKNEERQVSERFGNKFSEN